MLGRLGWPDDPVLMVGNDVEQDLIPAATLGTGDVSFSGRHPIRKRIRGHRYRADGGTARLAGGDGSRVALACVLLFGFFAGYIAIHARRVDRSARTPRT